MGWRARHRWLWRSRTWAIGIVLLNGITFLPLGLPVLPGSVVASANLQKVNYNLGERIYDDMLAYRGFPEDLFVGNDQFRGALRRLIERPAQDR